MLKLSGRAKPPTRGAIFRAALGLVALVAAFVSYRHMIGLAGDHGEDRINRAILPATVDAPALIAAGWLLVLAKSGHKGGRLLAWFVFGLCSAASVAANVLQAEPSIEGRVIAAWPPMILIPAFELILRMVAPEQAAEQPSTEVGAGEHEPSSPSAVLGDAPVTSTAATPAVLPAPARQVDGGHAEYHGGPLGLASAPPAGPLGRVGAPEKTGHRPSEPPTPPEQPAGDIGAPEHRVEQRAEHEHSEPSTEVGAPEQAERRCPGCDNPIEGSPSKVYCSDTCRFRVKRRARAGVA